MVYRDVSIHEGAVDPDRPDPIYTVSVDEKPGIQALGLTAPDLPPVPGKASAIGATMSTSAMAPCRSWPGSTSTQATSSRPWRTVTGASSSSAAAPSRCLLPSRGGHPGRARQPLSHISRETRAYLATRPGRFEYVHTPQARFLAQPDRVRFLEDGRPSCVTSGSIRWTSSRPASWRASPSSTTRPSCSAGTSSTWDSFDA